MRSSERTNNWGMLVITIIAATASLVAITRFRRHADDYREKEVLVSRLEGEFQQLALLTLEQSPNDVAHATQEASISKDIHNEFSSLLRFSSDPKLESVLNDINRYAILQNADGGGAKISPSDLAQLHRKIINQLREVSALYEEGAQTAIFKADMEGLLGLVAFVIALSGIVWRMGSMRHQQDVLAMEQRVLEVSEKRFRLLTERSSDLILVADENGVVQFAGGAVPAPLITQDTKARPNLIDLAHADDQPVVTHLLRSASDSSLGGSCEARFKDFGDSFYRWMELHARDERAELGGVLVNARDITERKAAEEQLLHDALHDSLTSLPNRALFLDRLQRATHRKSRDDDFRFAVLFIDLDRFKMVNDSLGHGNGDRLIIEVAERLSSSVRGPVLLPHRGGDDTLARLGGDEFTLLIEEIQASTDAIRVAERILTLFKEPFVIDGVEIFANASIGIAIGSPDHKNGAEVLRDADLAMYRAKALGGARFEVFDGAMFDKAVNRLRLESELRQAIEREQLEVFFQPIVSLSNFHIVSAEALLRWKHPERGYVPPSEFIPLAEESGLIVQLGRWMLREACIKFKAISSQFESGQLTSFSVNLSGKEFAQPDLVPFISSVLNETGIDPTTLRVEITETVVMGDVEHDIAVLQRLRALGVRVSIDDFGTGYSSLSYLHRFPIDTLKIDRSFISAMNNDDESREIVRTIMSLASNLGMDVVAEGTEHEVQVEHLKALGCEFAQGYYFSKPVDSSGFIDVLAKRTLRKIAAMAATPLSK